MIAKAEKAEAEGRKEWMKHVRKRNMKETSYCYCLSL